MLWCWNVSSEFVVIMFMSMSRQISFRVNGRDSLMKLAIILRLAIWLMGTPNAALKPRQVVTPRLGS